MSSPQGLRQEPPQAAENSLEIAFLAQTVRACPSRGCDMGRPVQGEPRVAVLHGLISARLANTVGAVTAPWRAFEAKRGAHARTTSPSAWGLRASLTQSRGARLSRTPLSAKTTSCFACHTLPKPRRTPLACETDLVPRVPRASFAWLYTNECYTRPTPGRTPIACHARPSPGRPPLVRFPSAPYAWMYATASLAAMYPESMHRP